MTENFLQQVLQNLRRRALALGIGAGAAWGVAAGVLVLIACVWFDLVFEMSPTLRRISGLAALSAVAGLLVAFVRITLRNSGPRALAGRLDSAAKTNGQILSGVDLALHPTAIGDAAVTKGLTTLAVEEAAKLAKSIQPAIALPAGQLRRACAALGVLALLIGGVAIVSPRFVATEWLRFTEPGADHPPYSRILLNVQPGDMKVVFGGGVDISAKPQGGIVDRMELVLRTAGEDETLPMFPQSDGTWRATVASVTSPARYFARAGSARSKQYGLDVITVPKIEAVTFHVTPPAYTNRPPYEGPLPQGGLAGLPGTVVEVHAKSNRPLSGGRIQFAASPATTQPAAMEMRTEASQDKQATGSFTIRHPGKVNITVKDVAGQDSTDIFTASINVLPDDRPFVRIMEPPAQSFATPDVMLPVVALAEDDWGVSRVDLFRGLNESRARGTEVAAPAPPPTKISADSRLRLADYGLVPGDEIKLFARAEDNDPDGAKGSESSIVTVRIVSREQMQQMLLSREGMEVLQSKYEQAARRMEALDQQIADAIKELEKLDPNSELAQQKRDELSKLAEAFAREAKGVEEAAAHDLPFDLDKALREHLKNVAGNMNKAGERVEKMASRAGLGVSGALDELKEIRKELGAQREQFKDDTTAPLEHLAKIFPLIEDQARYIELYQRQRDLEQRMASLKTTTTGDDPKLKTRMRDLEGEQRRVGQDLRDLLHDIDNHVAELPADPKLDDLRKTADEFAKAVRKSAASDSINKAQTALADFDGPASWAGAKDAADILESFLSNCNAVSGSGNVCLRFQPKLAASLGNTVDQLLGGMGLGGMGNGTGGYSAQRNSLANVGLYGNLPTRSQAGNSGGRADRGTGSTSEIQPLNDPRADRFGQHGQTRAAGESQANVPMQYRQRTGEYFQRVADELGK